MSGYKPVAIRALRWLTSLQIISTVVSQLSYVVLAVLLNPADFGLLGVAMVAVSLVAIPGDLGLTVNLVQRPGVRAAFPTAVRLRWLVAAVLTAATLLLAPIFGWVFGSPQAVLLIGVLAGIFPAAAVGFGPRVLLTRNLDFRRLALADLAGRLGGPLLAVLFALRGFGYWSLAAAMLTSAWLPSLILLYLRPIPSGGRPDYSVARSLVAFGKYVSLGTLFGFLLFTADNVVMVYSFGIVLLGHYLLAFSFAVTIPRGISGMIETVLFPVFSRISGDRVRLRKGYVTSLTYVSYFAFPLAVGFLLLSPEFVSVILGTKWGPSAVFMQILAVAGLFYCLSVPASSALLGLGHPKAVAWATASGAAVLGVGLLTAMTLRMPEAVAAGSAAGALTYFVHLGRRLARAAPITSLDILRANSGPATASGIGGMLGLSVVSILPWSVWNLAAAILIGVSAYAVTLQAVSKGAFFRTVRELTYLLLTREDPAVERQHTR